MSSPSPQANDPADLPPATDPSPSGSAPTPAPILPPPSPTSAPTLTQFRLRGDCVLDFPLPVRAYSQLWAATVWPDGRQPSGWAREFWKPGPTRGFIPSLVDLGDVIQFSAQHAPAAFTKWNGYLHAVHRDSLVIHGPHPTLHAAHAAAQLALIHQSHTGPAPQPDPRGPTAGITLPTTAATPTTTIAQPPTSITAAFHGPHATIGDPHHGWLVVDTAALTAAMTHPPEHLRDLLRSRVPTLTGDEAPVVLAALAATHLPHDLPPPARRQAPSTPTTTAPTPDLNDAADAATATPSTAAASPSETAAPSAFIWAPPDPFLDGSL